MVDEQLADKDRSYISPMSRAEGLCGLRTLEVRVGFGLRENTQKPKVPQGVCQKLRKPKALIENLPATVVLLLFEGSFF